MSTSGHKATPQTSHHSYRVGLGVVESGVDEGHERRQHTQARFEHQLLLARCAIHTTPKYKSADKRTPCHKPNHANDADTDTDTGTHAHVRGACDASS